VNGNKIKPVDLTAKLLFPFWSPNKGEKDFTVLDILIEGNENGKKLLITIMFLTSTIQRER